MIVSMPILIGIATIKNNSVNPINLTIVLNPPSL